MSKRAAVRKQQRDKKRAIAKRAADEAKEAQADEDRKWLREQRQKAGLPVDEPSEKAYLERVAEAARKAREKGWL